MPRSCDIFGAKHQDGKHERHFGMKQPTPTLRGSCTTSRCGWVFRATRLIFLSFNRFRPYPFGALFASPFRHVDGQRLCATCTLLCQPTLMDIPDGKCSNRCVQTL